MKRTPLATTLGALAAGTALVAGAAATDPPPAAAAPLTVTGVAVPGWADDQTVLIDARSRPYLLKGRGSERISRAGRVRVRVAGRLAGAERGAPGIRQIRVYETYTGRRDPKSKAVRLKRLRNRATVRGKRRIAVRVRTRGRLELRIDGRRRAHQVMRRAGWGRLSWNTRSVRNGSHLVEVSLWRGTRRIGVDRRWVRVANSRGSRRAPAGGGSALPPPGPNEPLPGRRVFAADYEGGTTSPWRTRETVASERIRSVTSPKAAKGRRSARFEVRPGEDPIGNFGDRAELAFAGPSIEEGQEYWYEWFTLFPQSFPIESGRVWQVFTQWHSRADGPPPLGWYVEGNQIVLTANRTASPGNRLGARVLWRGPIKRGQWRRIRMNVMFSGSDSVGYVRLWVDGKVAINKVNVRTTFPGIGNYFKQGYYRCACSGNTVVVHHDGLMITRVR
jgi:hypothetical protein